MRKLAAFILILVLSIPLNAETKKTQPKVPTSATTEAKAASDRLPVKRVVLYKNGVGYFEHTGQVHGTQELSIDFTTGQLNDVIKSLTVLDLGQGKISGVRYNSTAPLAERLKGLRLPVGEQTTLAGFLSALRGARVEIRSGAASATGRLLSVDEREIKKGEFTTTVTEASVVSDSGELRVFEVTPSTSIRIIERDLNQEVGKYMGLVSSTRERDIRRMIISAEGTGDRQLFVSYISEVPIWKSTYRIVLPTDPKAKPLLQGWAVVDNTVGEDWKDVQLSLVAGAPQSFIQQLSQPYYGRRPSVAMPQAFQLSPQTHEETIETANAPPPPPPHQGAQYDRLEQFSKQRSAPSASGGFGGGAFRVGGGVSGGVVGGGNITGVINDATGAVIANARVTARNNATGATLSAMTDGSGRYSFNNLASGSYSVDVAADGFQRSVNRNVYVAPGATASNSANLSVGSATTAVEVLADNSAVDVAAVAENLESEAEGKELGDLFEYNLKQRVTIGKNQSALVPIVHAHIEADKVSLWNPAHPRALRAVWVKNTSGLSLDAGTFNILEDNTFAGEGLMDVIKPGESRLLSYATDQAIHIEAKNHTEHDRVTRVRIVHGVMMQTRGQHEKRTYKIRNADKTARNVVIEHPARAGWKLVSETQPKETTSSFLRFRVSAEPNKTTDLVVDEVQQFETRIAISSINDDQIALFLQQKTIDEKLGKTLRDIVAQRGVVAGLDNQIQQRHVETGAIEQDQQRLRENMKALKGTPDEKMLTQRYVSQLNQQEDRLAVMQKEISDLTNQLNKSREKLSQMIENISMDLPVTM